MHFWQMTKLSKHIWIRKQIFEGNKNLTALSSCVLWARVNTVDVFADQESAFSVYLKTWNQPHYSHPSVCPSASAPPAAASSPGDVLEALEQRRAKYIEASNQAKANGDDRKARMHDRISKVTLGCHVCIFTVFIPVALKGSARLIKSSKGVKLTMKPFSLFWVIIII